MKKSEPIEKIRKRFDREWLLIEIDKIDEKRTVPLTGHLVAHSPRRYEIYDAMRNRPARFDFLVFSQDALPEGYHAAF